MLFVYSTIFNYKLNFSLFLKYFLTYHTAVGTGNHVAMWPITTIATCLTSLFCLRF